MSLERIKVQLKEALQRPEVFRGPRELTHNIDTYLSIPGHKIEDIEKSYELDSTLLNLAISLHCTDLVKLLIQKYHVDVNLPDQMGNTPLIEAARGSSDIVKLLIKAGADPTYTRKDGEFALHIAVSNPHYDGIKILKWLLLNEGITMIDKRVYPPKKYICPLSYPKPEPSMHEEQGHTPIEEAACFPNSQRRRNQYQIPNVAYLVSMGANTRLIFDKPKEWDKEYPDVALRTQEIANIVHGCDELIDPKAAFFDQYSVYKENEKTCVNYFNRPFIARNEEIIEAANRLPIFLQKVGLSTPAVMLVMSYYSGGHKFNKIVKSTLTSSSILDSKSKLYTPSYNRISAHVKLTSAFTFLYLAAKAYVFYRENLKNKRLQLS